MKTRHVPSPSRTLDPSLVESLLASCKNQFLTVTFYKTNGEVRTYNGQLRAISRLVGNERGKAQGEAMRARGQHWLALPSGESKSFYADRVIGLRCKGARVEVGEHPGA